MSFSDFCALAFSGLAPFLSILLTLAVAFVNGWTDAPNAIASCVASRSLSIRKAVAFAAVADSIGAVVAGASGLHVAKTMVDMAGLGDDKRLALVSICAAMSAVALWATAAWAFGIPTSESHALIAGILGASIAVNGGFSGISVNSWLKVLLGIAVSSGLGVSSGFLSSKATLAIFGKRDKLTVDRFFKYSQIAASGLMAFMHGAQDSQKFIGILMLVTSLAAGGQNGNRAPVWMIALCSAVIGLGTATGGVRIIKSVGIDMVKLRRDQGFAADLAGAFCLFISTALGLPVSTTQTKTSAVLGAGLAKSAKSVNWSVAGEMVAAWLLTFPGCGLLAWAVACIYLKLF